MTALSTKNALDERELVQHILTRMAADLSMILDRDLLFERVSVEHSRQRTAGDGTVHISFKLGLDIAGEARQGCLLMPLPEALALAGYMMMLPDDAVGRERSRTELDASFKEALLEVGKFLAGACDAVLRRALPVEIKTRSDGCQGVRAGVRPALDYNDGDPLLVARAQARIHEFEPFELILMLPSIEQAALESVSG